MPSSNLHLDILMGKDESIDFEDFLNGMLIWDELCCMTGKLIMTYDRSQHVHRHPRYPWCYGAQVEP